MSANIIRRLAGKVALVTGGSSSIGAAYGAIGTSRAIDSARCYAGGDIAARCPYYENCQACFFWFLFYQFIGDSVQADGWDTRKETSAKEVGVGRVSGGLPWRG